MAREIIWSLTAQADRKAIFAYWNKRNQSTTYSIKLKQLFNETIKFLSEHPQIGRPTILENIRVKVVRDHLLIYEVNELQIIIHTIWDGRRNSGGMDI